MIDDIYKVCVYIYNAGPPTNINTECSLATDCFIVDVLVFHTWTLYNTCNILLITKQNA